MDGPNSRNVKGSKKSKIKKYRIICPKTLCLYGEDSLIGTIEFFEAIAKFPGDKNIQIEIDMTDVLYISAAAITKLFNSVASRQLSVAFSHVVVRLPKDKSIRALLRDNGFVKAVSQGGLKKLNSLWEVSNFVCGNQKDVVRFLNKIKALSKRAALPNKLGVAIKESLINVNHHAYTGVGSKPEMIWWCYIYVGVDDENRQYLATVITDNGIGIPNTIRPVLTDGKIIFKGKYLHCDGYCINQAMQESVTSTMESGRGKGSVDIKKPVQVASEIGQHHLLVISGFGKYTFEVDEKGIALEEYSKMDSAYSGTLIEWFLYFEEK